MTARKNRQEAAQVVQPAKAVSVYAEIIQAVSLVEVTMRSLKQTDTGSLELVALKCALKSLWLAHDRLEELGIRDATDNDDD